MSEKSLTHGKLSKRGGELSDPSGIRTRVPPAPNPPIPTGFSPDLNTRSAPSPVPLPSALRCAAPDADCEQGSDFCDLYESGEVSRPCVAACAVAPQPAPPPAEAPPPERQANGADRCECGHYRNWHGGMGLGVATFCKECQCAGFTLEGPRGCLRCGAAHGQPCDPAKHDAHADPSPVQAAWARVTEERWRRAAEPSTLAADLASDLLAGPNPRDARFSSALLQSLWAAHTRDCDRCLEALDAADLCEKGLAIWEGVVAAEPPTPIDRSGVVRVVVVESTQVKGALSLRLDGADRGFSALAGAMAAAGFRPGDVLDLRRPS